MVCYSSWRIMISLQWIPSCTWVTSPWQSNPLALLCSRMPRFGCVRFTAVNLMSKIGTRLLKPVVFCSHDCSHMQWRFKAFKTFLIWWNYRKYAEHKLLIKSHVKVFFLFFFLQMLRLLEENWWDHRFFICNILNFSLEHLQELLIGRR